MATFFKKLVDFKLVNLKTRKITGLVMGGISVLVSYLAVVLLGWSELGQNYLFDFAWMAVFGFFFAGIMIKKNF